MIIVQHVKTGLYVSHSLNANRRDSILQAVNGNSRGINIHADVLEELLEKVYQASNIMVSNQHLDGKTYTETVAAAFKYIISIIDNIPGTVDDADMRMAMVAIDGTQFNTLRERLEYDLKYCLALANPDQDGLMPKEYAARFKYDEVAGKPAKIMEFNIARHIAHSNAIPQSAVYSRGTGFWYIMQRVDNGAGGSNLHVLQFDGTEPTGEWMDLTNTYHGSVFFVRTVSGVDHIFASLNRSANGSPTSAEITWQSKVSKGWGSDGVKQVGIATNREPYVVWDERNNMAVVRYVGTANNDDIVVYRYDDWYNGRDVIQSQFKINGAQYYPCQGFDANDGKFYWHSGTDANSNERVSVFDYNGKLLIGRDLTGYNLIGSDTAQGKAEPEGLCLVTDDGGNPMIAFGHACGPQYGRRYIMHAFNFESWMQNFAGSGGTSSQTAKHAPVSIANLSTLGSGWWYLTATQMRAVTDKPQDFIKYKDIFDYKKTWIYAVLLEVVKGPNGYVYQHLMQLRPSHKRKAWNRIRYSSGWGNSDNYGSLGYHWVPDDGQVLLWKGTPSGISAKGATASFYQHVTHYHYIMIGWKNKSASDDTIKYLRIKVTKNANGSMAAKDVPIHDLNLPNKLGTQGQNFAWFYECNLHILSNYLKITNNLRISMAPDWKAGIPNTTANKIWIEEVWGVLDE
ncbi:phage baseplate protein [Lactiplantibacillus mudanjiangensis]|uniref:P68 RBP/TagC-like beta-propeller domain-containing protein n=1 Tax=Lactiplantibacillus mudanjiangensis TaxID=1296538 RepID=A0A660DXB7_9LACO|nr:hypothetical protein [Lactiplantibacillus mudanjiangensis]VDG26341.1 hypothetical protein MUDAN_IGPPGNFN_01688 [Lactiplantibacillus mudanjiangensis]VDG27865.1 hypothetical protein MUDAN_MDHGFNIF_02683 [Lactiplantibacillus mudanjiangensis]